MMKPHIILCFLLLALISQAQDAPDYDANLKLLFERADKQKNKDHILALQTLDTIRSIATANQDAYNMSKFYLQKWSVYTNIEDTLLAKTYQDSLKGMYENREKDEIYHFYRLSLAISHHVKKEYDPAMEIYQEVIDQSDTSWNNYLLMSTRSLINMANIYRNRTEYDKAVEALQQGLVLIDDYAAHHDDVEDKVGIHNLYNGIGLIYRRTQEYDKAIEMYEKGISALETDDNRRYLMDLNVINCMFRLGDFQGAKSRSDLIYEKHQTLPKYNQYNYFCDRARIGLGIEDYAFTKEAIDSALVLQNRYDIKATTLLGIESEYYFQKEDYSQAIKKFELYDLTLPENLPNSKISAIQLSLIHI